MLQKSLTTTLFIGKLSKAFLPKQRRQFLLGHGVFDHNYQQTVQILFPFSLFLLRFSAENGLLGLIEFFRSNSPRFVKKYNLSVHFHKGELFIWFMPFR